MNDFVYRLAVFGHPSQPCQRLSSCHETRCLMLQHPRHISMSPCFLKWCMFKNTLDFHASSLARIQKNHFKTVASVTGEMKRNLRRCSVKRKWSMKQSSEICLLGVPPTNMQRRKRLELGTHTSTSVLNFNSWLADGAAAKESSFGGCRISAVPLWPLGCSKQQLQAETVVAVAKVASR